MGATNPDRCRFGRITALGQPAFLLIVVLISIACGEPEPVISKPLPTMASWVPGAPCLGIGTGLRLHGDPNDSAVTWAVAPSTGLRLELIWPVGYRAEFWPDLVVFDERNRIVARAGDTIVGGCPQGEGGLGFGPILVSSEDVAR